MNPANLVHSMDVKMNSDFAVWLKHTDVELCSAWMASMYGKKLSNQERDELSCASRKWRHMCSK